MRLVRRLGVLSLLLCLVSAAAHADDEDFSHSGLYLGVGGSYVTDTFESSLEDALDDVFPGISIDVEESLGANAVVGYRILPFLAIEAEYEWIDEFEIKVFGVKAATLEAQTLTGNLKWIVPTWRIQPYLLTGAGVTRWKLEDKLGFSVSETSTDFAGRLGVGLDLYVTPHILLTAGANAVLTATDFSVAGEKVEPIFYVGGQAGLQYRF